ncbi:MAG: hypothetical protein HOM01_09655 [Kordiimonadaceae bacterium]|nr:hypothetical protein [Kordiimonadaceae bacterium]
MDENIVTVDFTARDTQDNIINFPHKEWIEAGIKIMREKSAESISIDAICEVMNKQEKDFLLCFNGLESYIYSLLDYWYEK